MFQFARGFKRPSLSVMSTWAGRAGWRLPASASGFPSSTPTVWGGVWAVWEKG